MKNLLLLHGALGSSAQLESTAALLRNDFKIILLNFSGHGGKEIGDEPFSIEMFSDDIVRAIEKGRLGRTDIFGYSMGGYAALHAARHYPDYVGKIFTLATKFDWSRENSIRESEKLNPEKIKSKVPKFAERLNALHAPVNWETVVKKTSEMMLSMSENTPLKDEDLMAVENETQLGVGDRDAMVTIEETAAAYRKLRNGKLLVLPGTEHPYEKVSLHRITDEIKTFFSDK